MKVSTALNVASFAAPELKLGQLAVKGGMAAGKFALKEAGKFGVKQAAESGLEHAFGLHGSQASNNPEASGGQGGHDDAVQQAIQSTMPSPLD